jgi:hypothetical protein
MNRKNLSPQGPPKVHFASDGRGASEGASASAVKISKRSAAVSQPSRSMSARAAADAPRTAAVREELQAERELILDLIEEINGMICNLNWWIKNGQTPNEDLEN